jgi:hypothetical protein
VLHIHLTRGRTPATALLLLGVLGGVAGCGGSSGSDKTQNAGSGAQVSGSTSATATSAQGSAAALRACLARNGITVPPGAEAELQAGKVPTLPAGVTRAHAEAVIRRCIGSSKASGSSSSSGSSGADGSSSATRAKPKQVVKLSKFVECMRDHGVKLPPPKVSGNGVVLDYKAVDTSSAKYQNALSACARQVLGKAGIGNINLSKAGVRRAQLRGTVKIKAVQIPGLHIHIEGLHLNLKGLKLPPIHVNVPAPSVSAGSAGGAPSQGEGSAPSEEEESSNP